MLIVVDDKYSEYYMEIYTSWPRFIHYIYTSGSKSSVVRLPTNFEEAYLHVLCIRFQCLHIKWYTISCNECIN